MEDTVWPRTERRTLVVAFTETWNENDIQERAYLTDIEAAIRRGNGYHGISDVRAVELTDALTGNDVLLSID